MSLSKMRVMSNENIIEFGILLHDAAISIASAANSKVKELRWLILIAVKLQLTSG